MIRIADINDKNCVNLIRRQVHELHAKARPDMFQSQFSKLANRYDEFVNNNEYSVLVCERNSTIVGFAVVKNVTLPESAYAVERKFLLIEEIGVDAKHRRCGVGTELINYVKDFARRSNLSRLQLDVWAFNDVANEFYSAQGFETYRKYLEINL